MEYNFDEVIDRKNNHSAKHCETFKKFGKEDVIPLWVADMDFKTAQPIIDKLEEKAIHGIFGYTSRPDSYNEAFINWQLKRNNFKVDKDLISFSFGVVPSLIYMIQYLTKENDKILIQTPVYQEFKSSIESFNRTCVTNSLKLIGSKYEIDFEDFERKIVNGVKMFILCNPHNPIGKIFTPEELIKMGDICIKHNVIIISDEIHSDLILKGKHTVFASISEKFAKQTISLFSATKTFNLAGLHASTILFNTKEEKDKYEHYLNIMDIQRNNCFSVVAMESAYNYGEEWLTQLLEYIRGNVEFIVNYCNKNIKKIKPMDIESTYLMWLDCRELNMSNKELNDFFINEANLGLNSGATFGVEGEGFMRLNIATQRSVLEKALKNLEIAVNKLH